MISTVRGARIEEIAQDLFEVTTHLSLATPRPRRHVDNLKEVEFLTLALLHERRAMIVGEIQRLLGVLPAQMSRIIRSLEKRAAPFIVCQINSGDKRKIDVTLTEQGAKALLDYQSLRVHRIAELLRGLGEDDQEELVQLLDKVRCLLGKAGN